MTWLGSYERCDKMDPVLSDLILMATYDIGKYIINKKLKDSFTKDFSQIFSDTLSDISKKYNVSKSNLENFFHSEEVNEHLKQHLEDRSIDYKYLSRILINEYITLDPSQSSEEILNDIFNKLEVKLIENPKLKDKLYLKYFNVLLHNYQNTVKNVDLVIEKQDQLQKRLSQADKKPELVLSFFGNPLIDYVIWALPIPKDTIVELPLKYMIENKGGRSTRKFEVYARMSKALHYDGLGALSVEFPPIKDIKYGITNDTDYVHTLSMSIDALFPDQKAVIRDWISINRGTSSKQIVDATSKDGIDMKLKVLVDFSFAINFTIFQEDLPKIQKKFCVSIINKPFSKLAKYFQIRNKTCNKESRSSNQIEAFLLNYCELNNLQKNKDIPFIFRVKDYKTCEGTRDNHGYTIPTLGIFPKEY